MFLCYSNATATKRSNFLNNFLAKRKQNAKQKQEANTAYNNGDVKVLIFTLAIKEGISFLETDTFIFSQPYWNYAISEQIIARAIRSNSHAKKNKALVEVYLLCGFDKHTSKNNISAWKNYIENIFNSDIKIRCLIH